MKLKLISGAQTGADRAGLDFAIANNLPHGGWCPAGRRAEDGCIPDKYQLQETESSDYKERTEKNVLEAHATVIFNMGHKMSPGSGLTARLCHKYHKPYVVLYMMSATDDAKAIKDMIFGEFPGLNNMPEFIMNVAGNRESTTPGVHDYVMRVLHQVIGDNHA